MAFGIMASTPQLSEPDEKDLGPDDSASMVSTSTVSGSSTINLRTPTSSSASTSTPNRSDNIPYITRNSAPGPGSTYVIVEKCSSDNKALTVTEGCLRLATPLELLPNPPVLDWTQAKAFVGACNWHWHCEESDGWLGFRNAATGRWLGSAVPNKASETVCIKASATEFGVTEQFCVRMEKDGEEYALLKRVDLKKGVYLMPVGLNQGLAHLMNGCLSCLHASTAVLIALKMTWEFVRVDDGFLFDTGTEVDPLDL